jgi:hypothetical protein
MKTLLTVLLAFVMNFTIAQISITRPIHNSVLQRNATNNLSVSIAGQLLNNSNLYPTMQYRIQQLSPQNSSYLSTPINWTSYSCNYGGLFEFTEYLAGGWYQLDVQGTVNGSAQTASVTFGVGEVFIIAGQSNAQGVTGNIYNGTGSAPYDGVVADLHLENSGCISQFPLYPSLNKLTVGSHIAPQGKNNWCYTVLGNQLVDNIGVPVAFFNAAQFSTGVEDWVESIQNPSAYTTNTYGYAVCDANYNGTGTSSGGAGHPYIALKKTLQIYGSLFGSRAILWHQGENDAHDANYAGATGGDYITRLRTIINQARSDFGHSDLSWWICQVSLSDASLTNSSIIAAQGTVQTDSYNKAGPYTDPIGPRVSSSDVHFTGVGLYNLGSAWYTSIGGSTLNSATPATPNAPLHITLTGSMSSGFNLLAPSGFSHYFWTDPAQNRLDLSSPTSQNVYGASGSYICYALHPNGQWFISQVVRIPYDGPGGGARISASSEAQVDDYLGYNVFPNPASDQTTISFNLSHPANVNLAIVDGSGKVVKQLVNGRHAEGSYKYPVSVSQFPVGVYLCNLTANDLHLTKKLIKETK